MLASHGTVVHPARDPGVTRGNAKYTSQAVVMAPAAARLCRLARSFHRSQLNEKFDLSPLSNLRFRNFKAHLDMFLLQPQKYRSV